MAVASASQMIAVDLGEHGQRHHRPLPRYGHGCPSPFISIISTIRGLLADIPDGSDATWAVGWSIATAVIGYVWSWWLFAPVALGCGVAEAALSRIHRSASPASNWARRRLAALLMMLRTRRGSSQIAAGAVLRRWTGHRSAAVSGVSVVDVGLLPPPKVTEYPGSAYYC